MGLRFAALTLILAVLLPPTSAQMHLPAGDAWYDMANVAIFREGEIATIHVQMSASHLNEMLANPWNEVEYPCTMRFTNSVIDETVPDIRIKIRGSTSRNSIKKSFKLSFNSVVPGTRFYGLKKLNIIGDQNDVSVVRAKVSLDALRAFGLPAQRALLTHFIINDGARVNDVYVTTEQMNDDFVEAWFGTNTGNLYKCGYQGARADLRYVSPGTPTTYRNLGNGETYKEEINEDNPNYQDLADFIYFINKSSDEQFRADLPKWLNVEGFLRNMAADVVVGQWDGIWFGANNYYLYHNPETGRFEYLPYDYDNTIGIDFFNIDWAKRGQIGRAHV
jgi:spore coat protein H